MKDGTPLSFAGIWQSWKSPAGEQIESVAILTTQSNELMASIHDRMPMILHQAEHDIWLERDVDDPCELQRLYQPYPSGLLQKWVVGHQVDSPHNDGELFS